PPTILVKPISQQVKAGGIASFYCTAKGAPTPQIHWRKNGKRISPSQSRYLVHNYDHGALLRIEPVRSGRDNYVYECVAENGVGDAVTAEASLTIYEGKSFIFQKTLILKKKTKNINDLIQPATSLVGLSSKKQKGNVKTSTEISEFPLDSQCG
ncbi:hypothetical protein M0802_005441, partial [Mischocyttarus mexicanus]